MEQNRCPRIGIIGCGQIAKIRHVPELAESKDAELAGFYDYVPEHARSLANRYGGCNLYFQ